MKRFILLTISFIIGSFGLIALKVPSKESQRIKPWNENPRYWQYNGKPVLLLGASDNDNLFQNEYVKSQLDSLAAVGGNYIRNTMSDRDPGNQRAFALSANGKYDLNRWNEKYWRRFENLLRLAEERQIIVQIEIWDRFDHSRDPWLTDPFNPANNMNYTFEETGLDSIYPVHPGQNKQPFFFSVPELKNVVPLLNFQKAFVKKILDVTLKFNNVLYCIDNETSGTEEWAVFWADFIKQNSNGKEVYITQMWDNWDVKSEIHKRTIDHLERFGYIDISQNSQITGRENWNNAQYVFDYIKNNPRPVNSTKIYGSDKGSWLNRGITTNHAIHTFCRNITGGFASSRFHRPPAGLGLSQNSVNCIKTIRKIEQKVKMWEIAPQMDLLKGNEENEIYLSASEGEKYMVYFTNGGKAKLDLSRRKGKYSVYWISTDDAKWSKPQVTTGGDWIDLDSGNRKNCFAIILKK
ncbi:MAG TPA: DUF6298 domain-containing protein [Draconibacterium sp.]|nr:DUF6298 domain-containing protein [Draconibacterium sp.]